MRDRCLVEQRSPRESEYVAASEIQFHAELNLAARIGGCDQPERCRVTGAAATTATCAGRAKDRGIGYIDELSHDL